MSLKKLITKGKEVEVEINGEKVKFTVFKPNQIVLEEIRRRSQVEIAKLKMSEELRETMALEVSQMSDKDVIESLATINLTIGMLKAGIKLQEEKYPELDVMRGVLEDPSAEKGAKKKAQEYIDKYQKELQKEIERLLEQKKAELKHRPIQDVREELIQERIRVEAETQAFMKLRLYQVGELCFYEGKKLSAHPDFQEFLERVDDSVLGQLINAIDELNLGGIDIKKSLSQMSS